MQTILSVLPLVWYGMMAGCASIVMLPHWDYRESARSHKQNALTKPLKLTGLNPKTKRQTQKNFLKENNNGFNCMSRPVYYYCFPSETILPSAWWLAVACALTCATARRWHCVRRETWLPKPACEATQNHPKPCRNPKRSAFLKEKNKARNPNKPSSPSNHLTSNISEAGKTASQKGWSSSWIPTCRDSLTSTAETPNLRLFLHTVGILQKWGINVYAKYMMWLKVNNSGKKNSKAKSTLQPQTGSISLN